MKYIHLWAGQVVSKALLEAYLDQSIYLRAWAKYDHEPPTGNGDEDAEPSPNLRYQFIEELMQSVSRNDYNELFVKLITNRSQPE